MNRAKKLGQKIVKARAANAPTYGSKDRSFNATHTHGKPTNALLASRQSSGGTRGGAVQSGGPAAPGSPMGFGKGYGLTYAQSHVKGRPSGKLRRYRNKRTQQQYEDSFVT